MYGHKIVEDIWINRQHGIPAIVKEIRNAQHFYLPDDLYQENCKKYRSAVWSSPNLKQFFPPFASLDLDSLRLPYPATLITYSSTRAMLVKEFIAPESLGIAMLLRLFQKEAVWKVVPEGIVACIPKDENSEIHCVLVGQNNALIARPTEAEINELTVRTADVATLFEFLTLLYCKNIITQENFPPKNLQKKRIRNGKQPIFTYKTLAISIPTTTKGAKNTVQPLFGGKNRVHTCRGTFRTYIAARPLFGKLVGKYWVPAHVRGRNKNGIISKDYNVSL